MEKTCTNCKHYHGRLDDTFSNYHFHDYCDFWERIIPTYKILEEDMYDDVEKGLAGCWAFTKKG